MAEKTVYIIDLNDKVTPKLKTVQGEADKTDSTFAKLKSSIGGMGGILAGAFSISAMVGFASEVTQTTAKFQGLRNSIKFASDTAQQGELSMQWLANLSKTYGLPLTELTEGFKTFQGAMMKTRFSANEVRTMFAQVSTGVTAMGLSSEDAKGTFLALGQIMGKGKVQAEELRGQIGERIPGAFAIAARAMGMTTSQLDKFMSDGKLLAEDFLPKFAAEMEKTFGEGAAANADSLSASLARASNAWTEMTLAVGNSSGGLMTGTLNLWTTLLDKIADQFREIDDIVKRDNIKIVLDKTSDDESYYKSRADQLRAAGKSRDEIEKTLQQSKDSRELFTGNKIDKLKAQIAEVRKSAIASAANSPDMIEGSISGRAGFTDKSNATSNSLLKKLMDELYVLEQTKGSGQGFIDKIVSSMFMPKNTLAVDATKTKIGKAGGLSLNESRNGETHITFNIETFQKNEFSKDGTNVNNSVIKSFLDQMADGLAIVLNDSQIAARQQ